MLIERRYHYIPLSTSYSEIHNIQSFFTGFPSELVKTATNITAAEEEAAAALAAAMLEASKGKGKKKAKAKEILFNGTDFSATSPVLVSLSPKSEPVKAIDPLAEEGALFDPDRALRDIALAGSRWKRRNVRQADMEVCLTVMWCCPLLMCYAVQVYVYRLMLEYSTLLRA